MRQFYLVFKNIIRSPLATNLTWSHCQELLSLKNNNLKTIYQDNTIGLIICRKDNKFIIEYSSDTRIFSRTYRISDN